MYKLRKPSYNYLQNMRATRNPIHEITIESSDTNLQNSIFAFIWIPDDLTHILIIIKKFSSIDKLNFTSNVIISVREQTSKMNINKKNRKKIVSNTETLFPDSFQFLIITTYHNYTRKNSLPTANLISRQM